MPTQKQLEANHRNAQLSTGPKTPEGKATAARNALKTGLLATRLEDTREREYDDDEDDDDQDGPAPDHHQTPDQAEAQAARDYDETTRLLGLSFHRDTAGAESLSKLSRHDNAIRRAFYKALHSLLPAQARRTGQPPPHVPKRHPALPSHPLSSQWDGKKLRNETKRTLMAVFSVTPDDENALNRALIQM